MRNLIAYIVLGGGLGFGAAVQPGPFQAFLLTRAVANGWRRTLPVCLAPLLSDGPIALLALLVLGQVPPAAQHVLRASGGVLLLVLASGTLRQPGQPAAGTPGPGGPLSIVQAALVNLLNPNPYIAWALVMGPAVVSAWGQHPAYAAAFLGAFYVTMVTANAVFVLLAGTARFLGSRSQRRIVAGSALLLGGLGLVLLVTGVLGFWTAAGR
jgi:threonine/homoserine/homoserine lactone efflux protein